MSLTRELLAELEDIINDIKYYDASHRLTDYLYHLFTQDWTKASEPPFFRYNGCLVSFLTNKKVLKISPDDSRPTGYEGTISLQKFIEEVYGYTTVKDLEDTLKEPNMLYPLARRISHEIEMYMSLISLR